MSSTIDRAEVVHHASHDTLLTETAPAGDRSVDAVVVPAARPARHLQTAMVLAADLDALLVVLCSGATNADEAGSLAGLVQGLRWIVIDFPRDYRLHLVKLKTSLAGARSRSDLSMKRNLGLLLGHQAGWRSVLFLDDDIRSIDADAVRAAARRVVPGGAVGIPATSFPDNSVVCHANRLVDPTQGVFVSGSALLVDCERIDSFFPAVYNEDWLFLAPALERGAVSAVGTSVQIEYDPFRDPDRAKREEFGDTLAEGLTALLHAGGDLADADADYWRVFLDRRRELVRRIRRDLRHVRMSVQQRVRVLRSLRAADRRRKDITGELLADYVTGWLADRTAWRAMIAHLTRDRTVELALATLGLAGRARMSTGQEMLSASRSS